MLRFPALAIVWSDEHFVGKPLLRLTLALAGKISLQINSTQKQFSLTYPYVQENTEGRNQGI
jgi:hypothetical protein